jgi:hypothetical protein
LQQVLGLLRPDHPRGEPEQSPRMAAIQLFEGACRALPAALGEPEIWMAVHRLSG